LRGHAALHCHLPLIEFGQYFRYFLHKFVIFSLFICECLAAQVGLQDLVKVTKLPGKEERVELFILVFETFFHDICFALDPKEGVQKVHAFH
jgi:hypothetical protein